LPSAQGPDRLPDVRHHGLPQGAVLQAIRWNFRYF
jgi:hypothetical protein